MHEMRKVLPRGRSQTPDYSRRPIRPCQTRSIFHISYEF